MTDPRWQTVRERHYLTPTTTDVDQWADPDPEFDAALDSLEEEHRNAMALALKGQTREGEIVRLQAEIERLREALGGIDRVLTLSKGMAEDVDDNEAALAEIVGEHPGWYDLAVRDWVHDTVRAALGGEE